MFGEEFRHSVGGDTVLNDEGFFGHQFRDFHDVLSLVRVSNRLPWNGLFDPDLDQLRLVIQGIDWQLKGYLAGMMTTLKVNGVEGRGDGMEVQDIMQPNVYCAVDKMTVRDLYLALLANEITGAPVLDSNDYLVGVVSISDVARCVAGDSDPCAVDYHSHPSKSQSSSIEPASIKKGQRVSDIMTPCIHRVAMNSSLEEALDIILDEDVHRVVVTHRGHVVGIVTSGDLLHAFREMLREQGED
jgi:CBS-domain-containing membrane protein